MQLCFELLELRLREDWSTSRTRSNCVARVIIVTMMEDDGTLGRGEAAPISRYGESVESIIAFLERIDASRLDAENVSGSMTYLESVASGQSAAKSALNCALLDMAAQRAKQPLHAFLGLGFREGYHQTSFSIGLDTPENVQRKVEAAAQFPVLKIKLGSNHDREILKAVRQVAPDKLLRVDANEAWHTREQALGMIDHLAGDGGIELVEQPMPAGTASDDLGWLKERSALPLFADESIHTVADLPLCAQHFHGVNIKLAKTAGITGAMKVLTVARGMGLKAMIGCMVESSVGITAAAHLAELANYLDLDGNLLVENDPFRGVCVKGGKLSFIHAPGDRGLCLGHDPN